MRTLALIPARGGSKGIPKKNIVPVNGKPLLHYTVESCKASNVDQVWVSTDDSEITSTAKAMGVEVMQRPKELAQDFSQSEDTLLHFANIVDFDILVFVQNTSPLVLTSDLNKGIEMVKTGRFDSAFSVCRESWKPKWSLTVKPIDWEPDNRPMRQEKPEYFTENGAFYVVTREVLLQTKLRYGGNIGVVEMPKERSFQIDDEADLNLVRKII